jgi:c-di-GMP-binding flagellar brake protein YcgR
MTETDRREYFRIRDKLPVEYRRINAEEFSRLADTIRYSSTKVCDESQETHFLKEKMSRRASEKDELFQYLQILEKKMDRIIDLLTRSSQDSSFQSVYVDVNISGAGIRFISDLPFKEKEYLELRFVLPVFSYPKITTLCEVIRSVPVSDGKGQGYDLAANFSVINEEDRDLLINYIFVKEREQLRIAKEKAES